MAYFDCDAIGTDPVGAVAVLSGRIGCRGVTTTCVSQTLYHQRSTGRYGAVTLTLKEPNPEDPGRSRTLRAVGAANDGGRWVFYAFGELQPFEEPDAYEQRRVRDRFTSEMLDRYCRALGIRLFDEEFYTGPGVIVESRVLYAGAATRPPEFTFAENRDRLHIIPGEAAALPG